VSPWLTFRHKVDTKTLLYDFKAGILLQVGTIVFFMPPDMSKAVVIKNNTTIQPRKNLYEGRISLKGPIGPFR